MNKLIHLPLADVVGLYPEVEVLLQTYHLDRADYQHTNLANLLRAKPLCETTFFSDLQAACSTAACVRFKTLDVKTLVENIVKTFHEGHRAQMAGLINDARFIEQKYAGQAECPEGIGRLLIDFLDDLAEHMDQEELLLFPSLIAAGSFNMFPQLAIAHHSHDRHLNMVEKLKQLTNNFSLPDDASIQWQEFYENLMEFILQLGMHISVENQLLLND